MRILPSLIALVLLMPPAMAQGTRVIARNTADSVVLRWAPVSAANWARNNRYGYKVERLTVSMTARTKAVRLSPDTLKPWGQEKFMAHFPKDHAYAPPVAQALYGRSFAAAPAPGDPGSFMDAANEQDMRWSIAMLYADFDAGVADALGLRWVDRTAEAGAYYLYRVITLDPAGSDTAMVGVDRAMGPDPVPRGPDLLAEEGERRITVYWSKEAQVAPFSGYWIERSRNGTEWKRLNTAPFLQADDEAHTAPESIRYTDTTIAGNYIRYQYRVIGITAFGELSSAAPAVAGMGRDRTPPPSPALKSVKDEKGRLVVRWEQPAGAKDLKGFRVEKAPTAEGSFFALHSGVLSPSTQQFTDTSTDLIGENHYRVVALDTAGNEGFSLGGYGSVADSIAPIAPYGITGDVDTNGVVTLRWHRGHEADLLGYRVFFANAEDHAFNNLSPQPLADTVFHDTISLRTLTKHIYYKVAAVDRSFNHSAMSAAIALLRPDKVPPVAPLFSDFQLTDTTVVLHIIPSSSADVASHRLFRKDEGAARVLIASWKGDRKLYVDTADDRVVFRRYTLQAVDSAGNASAESVPLEVRTHGRLARKAVDAPSVRKDPGGRAVAVSWAGSAASVARYVIYRSKNNGQWFSVGSVSGDVATFTDERLSGAGMYRYRVKAMHADGAEAPLGAESAAVQVP